jgi:hypothetical protein
MKSMAISSLRALLVAAICCSTFATVAANAAPVFSTLASAAVTYRFHGTYTVNVGDVNIETVRSSFVAVLDNYATTPDTPLWGGWYSTRYPANCTSTGWGNSTGRCIWISLLRSNALGWHLSDTMHDAVDVVGETCPPNSYCGGSGAPVQFPLGTFSTIGVSHVSYSDFVLYDGPGYDVHWDADLAVSNGIPTPEPSSLILLASGALGFTPYLRRRFRL